MPGGMGEPWGIGIIPLYMACIAAAGCMPIQGGIIAGDGHGMPPGIIGDMCGIGASELIACCCCIAAAAIIIDVAASDDAGIGGEGAAAAAAASLLSFSVSPALLSGFAADAGSGAGAGASCRGVRALGVANGGGNRGDAWMAPCDLSHVVTKLIDCGDSSGMAAPLTPPAGVFGGSIADEAVATGVGGARAAAVGVLPVRKGHAPIAPSAKCGVETDAGIGDHGCNRPDVAADAAARDPTGLEPAPLADGCRLSR